MTSPKVSVIVTAHNYDQYLRECLDSVLAQTYTDFELVVVDDGSTDDTPEILREYSYEHGDTVRIVTLDGKGLPTASNKGIEAARGDYIVRLDADDYFDENILTVESAYLDANPDVDLVYPDYYTIDEAGEIIDHVRNMRVNEEVKLLNRSPLAAGAMYRRSAWDAIGGYNEDLDYQEDYDFWIRFINRFTVQNVNLPLMYYRQHGTNMSNNLAGRLNARRDVKKEFIDANVAESIEDTEILGIVPARAEERFEPPSAAHGDVTSPLALHEISEEPLISYTIKEALAADRLDRVLVSTEDDEIASVAENLGADVPRLRDERFSERDVLLGELMGHVLDTLEEDEGYEPDFIVLLQYVSPLKTAEMIDEVVDTWMMFSVDSVITVAENDDFLWQPGKFGLEPLFDERLLREKRKTLYQETGSIYGFEPEPVHNKQEIIGETIGHVMMQEHLSLHIDSWFELKMCEMILENRNGLSPDYRSDI